jgi:NAD(P)-dependent dehydrogenase (short-subunit alcohol dehydrogenase family)
VTNRVAVITGAASGIGAACARLLIAEGWSVVGWDLASGPTDGVQWRSVDVSDAEAVRAAAGDVSMAHLLVNSAGISDRAPAADMRPEQWARVLDVNLSGTFYACQALYPALRRGGGTIINIASVAGHRAFAGRANYCAAKAGVVALTEVLGLEWAPDGVRVLAISPGFVATELFDAGVRAGFVSEEDVTARTPMARLADADEIARAILALASDAFSFATGATMIVDGGWNANGGF